MIASANRLIFRKVCLATLFLILGIVIIILNQNIAHNYVFPSRIIKALILQISICIQIFLLLYIFSVKISHTELKKVGLFLDKNSLCLFLNGASIAVFGASINWFLTLYIHGISYVISLEDFRLTEFVLWGCGSLLQTSYEELLFRTWLLILIAEFVGDFKAIGIGGLLFGLVHLLNPALSLLGIFNGVLVGIMFCFAFMKTGSVWMPIGLHFGWNFCKEILASPLLGKNTGGAIPNLESTVVTTISILLMGILVFYTIGVISKFRKPRNGPDGDKVGIS